MSFPFRSYSDPLLFPFPWNEEEDGTLELYYLIALLVAKNPTSTIGRSLGYSNKLCFLWFSHVKTSVPIWLIQHNEENCQWTYYFISTRGHDLILCINNPKNIFQHMLCFWNFLEFLALQLQLAGSSPINISKLIISSPYSLIATHLKERWRSYWLNFFVWAFFWCVRSI